MKRTTFFKSLYLSLILLLPAVTGRASHIMGGNITYECLGNNQYEVSLTMFFDCGTYNINTSGFQQSLTVTNDCGLANPTATLPYNAALSNIEVSQLCPSQLPNSECASPPGTQPGVWQATWTGTITLPAGCNSWHFWYSTCCWNSNTNTSGTPGQLYHTSLNNLTAPCDNSPFLAGQQIPYICANQVNTYSIGASDPDGNTLVYSLVPAQEGSAGSPTTVPYNGGYSGTAPIPGITIDPNTGLITVNPGITGNFIIQVNIESYDQNGNFIGVVTQQFQIVVVVCTNQVPSPSPTLSGITGNVVQTGPTSLEVCEGNNFCFNFTITDPDPTVNMTVTSNIATIFPGATVTVTGNNPWTVNICGQALPGSGGSNNILFNIQDDACPIPGMATLLVTMDVITSTYAGPDVTVCQGYGTQLQATGGSVFNWTVVTGPAISVPANFSCNPCSNPTATPTATTTYLVTSNLTGGCDNNDTVTVFVVPDFTYNVTQSSTSSCLGGTVDITTTVNPAGAYTYAWSPSNPNFGPANSPNPSFTPSTPGTFSFDLTISSAAGCVKTDNVTIQVAPATAPQIDVVTSASNLNCGQPATLTTTLLCGSGSGGTCGISAAPCNCPGSNVTVGTGTQVYGCNSPFPYCSPYGNWYSNEKTQYLFTAAELQALGFTGGKITGLSWDVVTLNGMNPFLPDYEIKMGCTATTSFTSNFESGLSTVWGPLDYTAVTGVNTHTFTNAYEWDGVSNLVIEVCYAPRALPDYTCNAGVRYTQTVGFNSTLNFSSDWQLACPMTTSTFAGSGTYRPNTTLMTCPTTPNPANYSFQWTGPPVIASPTSQNTTVTPTQNVNQYLMTVTDNVSGCQDTMSVFIYTTCCVPPVPTITNTTCNGGNDGKILIDILSANGPFDVEWEDAGGATLALNSGVVNQDSLTSLAPGTYHVIVTDSQGCVQDTTVVVGQPPVVNLNAVPDGIICLSANFNLSAVASGGNGGPYTMVWNQGLVGNGPFTVSPTTTTTYIVNVTDALGCSGDDDSVLVTVHPPLVASTSGSIQLCQGNSVTVSAGATGGQGSPYTFTWYQGANQIGTGSVITVAPVTNNTLYCVVVTDGCATPSDSACLMTSFYPQPVPVFTSNNVAGCYPVNTTFTNTTTPASLVATTEWEFGDGGTAVGNTVNYSYNVPNTDCYDVKMMVTSPNGCEAETTMVDHVCVYDYPDPSFSWNPFEPDIFNTFVQFYDASSPDAITFDWTIYDTTGLNVLATFNNQNPAYTFPNITGGTYPVSLVVSNNNGCIDTITYFVIINEVFTLYIPNAFTPDANGVNDIFIPRGESISSEDYEFRIFDRWGTLVFQTTDITKGWDGLDRKSLKAKSDTYVWKLKVKSSVDNKKYERYGHVLLLR